MYEVHDWIHKVFFSFAHSYLFNSFEDGIKRLGSD